MMHVLTQLCNLCNLSDQDRHLLLEEIRGTSHKNRDNDGASERRNTCLQSSRESVIGGAHDDDMHSPSGHELHR